jgi:hypothetical protein
MNPLAEIRNVAGGFLAPFRDHPVAQAAPKPQVQQFAAISKGGLVPVLLEAGDLTAGSWTSDLWSVVGYYRVPEGVIMRVPSGRSYRFYLRARNTFDGQDASITTSALTGLVKTEQGRPSDISGGVKYYPEVSVWCKVGGTWQRASITAIDFDTKKVTYTEPKSTTDVEVYYVHSVGQWRYRVYRALGNSDTTAASVANNSFSAAHLVDQNSVETSHKWPTDVVLIPGERLSLEVKTTLDTEFNSRAGNVATLQAYSQQVTVTDPQKLRQIAEIMVRQGL